MMRRQCLIALVAMLVVCAPWNAQAATIMASIDGGLSVNVPNYVIQAPDPDAGKTSIGIPGQDYFLLTSGNNSLMLSGILDPDPSMEIGVAATDGGLPSTFSISIVLPFNSPLAGPSMVYDSLSGVVLNGGGAQTGNVTVTALAPPVGIPVDNNNGTELQVFTLSTNGTNWQNVGLDAGPTTPIAITPGTGGPSGTYGSYTQGFIPTIAGGPWTHMRADFNFGLSGNGDIFNFASGKVIVPEPSTLLLALLSLGAAGFTRRRFAR